MFPTFEFHKREGEKVAGEDEEENMSGDTLLYSGVHFDPFVIFSVSLISDLVFLSLSLSLCVYMGSVVSTSSTFIMLLFACTSIVSLGDCVLVYFSVEEILFRFCL